MNNILLFSKEPDIEDLLPVLVYFHGGALTHGSGNYVDRTPDSLMKEDIVFVTVNYRLGVFGMLQRICHFQDFFITKTIIFLFFSNTINTIRVSKYAFRGM